MATAATTAGPTAPPSTYPSDDEILGIVDDAAPSSGAPHHTRSFGATSASRPNGAGRDAQSAPQDDVNFTDTAQNANSRDAASSDSAPIPEWLARVSAADPAAAPELAALWQRSSALETFDRAVYGDDSSAREQLITQLYSDDPSALRALVATASQLLDNPANDSVARVPRTRGFSTDSGNTPPANDFANQSRNSPANTNQTNVPAFGERGLHEQPTARDNDDANAAPQFSPAAYAQFEQSTNDAVISDVNRAIERALDRALPQGIADGARKRIAGDTLAEVHTALRGDRQLSSQVAAALRGSRFDGATRDAIARLIATRARGVVPEAARRVIGEWTGSVLASHRERTARTQANTSRVDVIGGALPAVAPRRGVKSADINYRSTSDEDILSW
jgi:hypothetical protein